MLSHSCCSGTQRVALSQRSAGAGHVAPAVSGAAVVLVLVLLVLVVSPHSTSSEPSKQSTCASHLNSCTHSQVTTCYVARVTLPKGRSLTLRMHSVLLHWNSCSSHTPLSSWGFLKHKNTIIELILPFKYFLSRVLKLQ